jgi:hypothetical protein
MLETLHVSRALSVVGDSVPGRCCPSAAGPPFYAGLRRSRIRRGSLATFYAQLGSRDGGNRTRWFRRIRSDLAPAIAAIFTQTNSFYTRHKTPSRPLPKKVYERGVSGRRRPGPAGLAAGRDSDTPSPVKFFSMGGPAALNRSAVRPGSATRALTPRWGNSTLRATTGPPCFLPAWGGALVLDSTHAG